MSIESVLYARLTGFAGLTALIGNRVHSTPAPQGVVVPFVTYEQISAVREAAMGGWIDALTTHFQLDLIAATAASRGQVRRQLIAAFQDWRDPASSPVVFGAHVENDQSTYDDETALYRAIIDVIVDHRENG